VVKARVCARHARDEMMLRERAAGEAHAVNQLAETRNLSSGSVAGVEICD
jgi:hypothetical protein